MSESPLVNPAQVHAFEDPSRHRIIIAGRRGGKTYELCEELLRAMHGAPYRAEVAYIGPTNAHAKELMWEPLEDALEDLGWRFKPQVSKQRFELMGKRKIYVIGAEKIARIRGHAMMMVCMDELAYWQVDLQEAWRAIRPTLTDLKGRAIAATTPDGKGTQAYDFLQWARESEWGYHYWRTIDNPFIPKDEIEEARRELDAKGFAQEYLATWESFGELAYYNFDQDKHVKKQGIPDPSRPLHLAFDFNVNPTTILLSQYVGERMHYFSEYSQTNSSTEQTVEAFCEDYKSKREHINIKIRGDAAGKSRHSSTGWSDYKYVQDILTKSGFKWEFEVAASNPPIVDRLKYVNGWLCPASGDHRIEIDPSCKELIKDLSSQGTKGRAPDPGKDNKRGHKADALGYDIYWQHSKSRITGQGAVQL